MDLRLPIKIEFKAEKLDANKWVIEYKEYFTHEDLKAARNAYEIIKNVPTINVNFSEDKGFIEVRLVDDRASVFDWVVGEFLCLSHLGNITISELLAVIGVVGARSTTMFNTPKAENPT